MMGKARRQEREVAGHTVRKQRRRDAAAQLAFSFVFSLEPQPRTPAREWTHIKDGSSGLN